MAGQARQGGASTGPGASALHSGWAVLRCTAAKPAQDPCPLPGSCACACCRCSFLIAYVAPAAQAAAVRAALQRAGCSHLLALDAGDWVRQLGALVGVHAPQQVVCALAAGPWLAAVLPWAGQAPLPASVLAGPAEAPPDSSTLAALLAAGMTGWWPVLDATQPPALLAAALQLDALRWQAGQALQATLADSRSALDERLWVDRAKGLLMQAGRAAPALRGDQAFAMLRSAAMHAKLRLAELSRAVVEATVWAEAIAHQRRTGRPAGPVDRCLRAQPAGAHVLSLRWGLGGGLCCSPVAPGT